MYRPIIFKCPIAAFILFKPAHKKCNLHVVEWDIVSCVVCLAHVVCVLLHLDYDVFDVDPDDDDADDDVLGSIHPMLIHTGQVTSLFLAFGTTWDIRLHCITAPFCG